MLSAASFAAFLSGHTGSVDIEVLLVGLRVALGCFPTRLGNAVKCRPGTDAESQSADLDDFAAPPACSQKQIFTVRTYTYIAHHVQI